MCCRLVFCLLAQDSALVGPPGGRLALAGRPLAGKARLARWPQFLDGGADVSKYNCMTWRSHGPGHRSAVLPGRLWLSWLAAPPPARLAQLRWLPALGEVSQCGQLAAVGSAWLPSGLRLWAQATPLSHMSLPVKGRQEGRQACRQGTSSKNFWSGLWPESETLACIMKADL